MERKFNQEELANITLAVVVESEFGKSILFTHKGGMITGIPLMGGSYTNNQVVDPSLVVIHLNELGKIVYVTIEE